MADKHGNGTAGTYPVARHFTEWLEGGKGRAAYFSRVDPGLFPAIISKMKSGRIPITFEYAVRLERAQKPSEAPLLAETIMTFKEHRDLYRYVTGREPAPAPVEVVRKTDHPATQPRTPVGA